MGELNPEPLGSFSEVFRYAGKEEKLPTAAVVEKVLCTNVTTKSIAALGEFSSVPRLLRENLSSDYRASSYWHSIILPELSRTSKPC